MEEEKKIRITPRTIVFMGVVALFYDFLQGLTTAAVIGLILSSLITIFAWLHFYVWFKIRGVSWSEGRLGKGLGKFIIRRWGAYMIAMLFELVPGVNAFPALTIGIVVTAIFVYLEDKAVEKNIISEEDLKEFQKYLSKNKRIFAGNINREDLRMLYTYGEKRVGEYGERKTREGLKKIQDSPRAQKIASIADAVTKEMERERRRGGI